MKKQEFNSSIPLLSTKKELQNITTSSLSLLQKEKDTILSDFMASCAVVKLNSTHKEILKKFKKLYKDNSPNVMKANGFYYYHTDEQIKAFQTNNPVCKCCSSVMSTQTGKFGTFFFCPNHCKEQKTLSEKTWLLFKNNHLNRLKEIEKNQKKMVVNL